VATIESDRVAKLSNRLPIIAREHGWQYDDPFIQRSRYSSELSNLDEELLSQILDPRSSRNIRLGNDTSVGPHIVCQFDPRIGPSPYDIANRLLDDLWMFRCAKVIVEGNDTTFIGAYEAEIVRFSGAGRRDQNNAQHVADLMVRYLGLHMNRSAIAWHENERKYKPLVIRKVRNNWRGAKFL
jgi:hypothetical protein